MNKKGEVYVRTVYQPQYLRKPNISVYDTIEEAQRFVDACLKWGIGIVSCEITDTPNLEEK